MLSLHDIEMDLRREGRKVLSVFASEAKMKKIELALEFGETLSLTKVYDVKTDPVRLGQVITNLVSNGELLAVVQSLILAIRFTASSDIRKITVGYDVSFVPPADDTCALPSSIGLPDMIPAPEDTPIWLFISVRDTGPGLGPKELAQLFKRFSRE
jgi:signal transduction histidine kinase